jgi:hypothetical protein
MRAERGGEVFEAAGGEKVFKGHAIRDLLDDADRLLALVFCWTTGSRHFSLELPPN